MSEMSDESEVSYDRPLLVTILAALYVLIGVIVVVAGIAVIALGGSVVDDLIASMGIEGVDLGWAAGLVGALCIVVGLVYLVIGYGFLKGWKSMWYLGVLFMVLDIIVSVVTVALGNFGSILTLIIAVILLLYLFKSNVKQFFLKRE